MKPQNIEQILKSAKSSHLSPETLLSYRDHQLDEIELVLADAHLRRCLLCEKELAFLTKAQKEVHEVLENYEVTDKDRALIGRVLDRMEPETKAPALGGTTAAPLERLAAWLNELTAAWVAFFSQEAMRGSRDGEKATRGEGEEVFRFERQGLTIWGELEPDASLTVYFSSADLSFEGARIRFRLGRFTELVTLEREGDTEVIGKIAIPRNQRARKMEDFSVEVVS